MSASGTPAERASNLLGEVLGLPPSSIDRIAQVEWRLRGLSFCCPGDLTVAVALIQARAGLGDAEGAIAIAERVWRHRVTLGPETRHAFVVQLASLGLYRSCIEFAQECLIAGGISNDVVNTIRHCAWYLGDLLLVRKSIDGLDGKAKSMWRAVVDTVDAYGLMVHMRPYRGIVNQALYGKQCCTDLIFVPSRDLPAAATQFVHLRTDRETRLRIEENIHDELDRFCLENGLADIPHWDLMPIIALDTIAAPTPRSKV